MSEIEEILGAWDVSPRNVEQAGVPGIYHIDPQDGEH